MGTPYSPEPPICSVLPGIAVPVGEAHRHEPPVPHDKVVVDEGQDREGPGESKLPSRRTDGGAPEGKGQMVLPLPESERERREPERGEAGRRPAQAQALEEAGGLPESPQKLPEGNDQPAVQPGKDHYGPGSRDLNPGPQAVIPAEQKVPAAGGGEPARGAAGSTEKPMESGPGGCGQPTLGSSPRGRLGKGLEGVITFLCPCLSCFTRLACECSSPFSSWWGRKSLVA